MGTINKIFGFMPALAQNSGLTRYPNRAILETTEANAQFDFPKCMIIFMGAFVQANTLNGITTINLRVGGVTQDSFTIAAGATGLQNKAVNVVVENLDLISFQIVTAGTTGTITFRGGGFIYE